LQGPGLTLDDVLAATEWVVPSIEIIDARVTEPRRIFDTVADNGAAAGLILGAQRFRPEEIDWRWAGALFRRNGEIEETGIAAGVMDHPANAVAWLGNKLSTYGGGLAAGHMVLSRSFTRPVWADPGDRLEADFGPLGTVTLTFGVPVCQLLGGKQRDVVPTFASFLATSIEQSLADTKTLADCVRIYPDGFDDSSIFDPRASLGRTVETLIAIRETFGRDLCLGIDLHHRYSPAEVASFCNMLPPGTLDFLEEPIRSESPEAYTTQRKMTNIPFAVGEEFASKWQAAPFLEQGLTQYMRLDICNIGGFTEAMKIAGWSEHHYVDLLPHNPLAPICTAASVHLSAAVPNFSWLETRQSPVESLGFHDKSLFPVQVELDGPVYRVPDAPGLGVEVDEQAIRASIAQHVECPHLTKPDGSVTNW